MDLHYKQEVTVGVLVLVGVGLFLGGTFWLRGFTVARGPQVQVVFPDVGTLKKGSPVRVSGVQLGTVRQIEFQDVGKVLVTLGLESEKVAPRIDATARLATVGLVADAVVNFHPGTATQPLPSDRPIQGSVDPGLTELGTDVGERAKELIAGVQEIANKQMADDLRETLRTLQRTLDVYANTRQGPTAELTRTLESLQQLSGRLDSTLVAADLPRTLRASDTLVSNLSGTSAEFTTTGARLDTLVQRLNRGEGTLGKLLADSLLYQDLRQLSRSVQDFVDELRKHPGKITVQIKVF
jgi:phospholipid/cholesterol/gamma-HCH transport system substrate-binding protein